MVSDREEQSAWAEKKPNREIERLKTLGKELEEKGDVVYNIYFREYPFSGDDIDLHTSGIDWFEPQFSEDQ